MRRFFPLMLLFTLSAVAFVGCDSSEEDDDSVLGRWVDTNEPEFLNISEDEIVVHYFLEDEPDSDDCYDRDVVDVVDVDGDEWTISEENFTQTIRLERDGDDLVISFDVEGDDDPETERYERSTQTDFSPLCD